ncbi:MAG: TIGR03943 family protein [Nocardioidaceae bacterium]
MFGFLLLTRRVSLYLGPRTAWVVPVGVVVILGVTALGIFVTARTHEPGVLRRGEALTAVLLLVPVVLVMTSPRTTLGTFSASRKTQFSGPGLWTYFGTFNDTSPTTLQFVTAAKYWPQATELLAKRAGSPVDFVGFVQRDASTPADEFLLTRFVVTCCVADAAVVNVRVVNVPPGLVSNDEWVELTGQIYPIGNEIIVTATSVNPVPTPEVAYLTP